MGLFLHLLAIGDYSIYILDEAKNAAAAMEMRQNKEWILPTFNGMPRYDKPPLHYYFFMLGYELFGVNALGARFFPALAGWVCFTMVYLYTSSMYGKRAGFFAGLALLASIHWVVQFHLAVPDPFLILFIFLSIIFYERFVSSSFKSKVCLRTSGLFLGLATLSKGPIALILVGFSVLVFMAIDRKPFWSHFKAILDFKAIALFMTIVLPWYVLIGLKTEGLWLREFVFHHNINRFSSAMEGHGGGFYLTFLFVLIGFFPASLVVYVALKRALLYRNLPTLIKLGSIFSIITLLFFMVSGTKLPNYTAPVYPFLAIIVGWYFANGQVQRFKQPAYYSSLFIILLPLGLFIVSRNIEIKEIESLSFWFLIPALLGLAALRIAYGNKWELAWTVGNLGFVAFSIILLIQVFPAIDHKNPVLKAKSIWKDQPRIFHFESFNPAFVFNTNKRIPSVPNNFIHLKRGDLILTNQKSLVNNEELKLKTSLVFEGDDLFENTVTVILRVE